MPASILYKNILKLTSKYVIFTMKGILTFFLFKDWFALSEYASSNSYILFSLIQFILILVKWLMHL